MASPVNSSLNHRGECIICLEDLAIRTTVTLRCRHTFHLDCLGSAFNAGNAMRCPVCRAVEEGVWRTFPTTAPRSTRAGAHVAQGNEQEGAVLMQPQPGISWYVDQGWFSGSLSHGNVGPIRRPSISERRHRQSAYMVMGSVNGSSRASASSDVTRITHLHLNVDRRPDYGYPVQGNVGPSERYDPFPQWMNSIQPVGLEAPNIVYQPVRLEAPDVAPIFNHRASAGGLFGPSARAAPVGRSMNSPSPVVRAMMRAANNRSSSHGLLSAEQMAFQAERSGTVNLQLPTIGEAVLGLSTDFQQENGIDGSESIMSDNEASIEDLSD